MQMSKVCVRAVLVAALWTSPLFAIPTTAINYQGYLKKNGVPVSGTVDIRATLLDVGANPIGSPVDKLGVAVSNGLFSVPLDFGVTNLNAHYLRIEVRSPAWDGQGAEPAFDSLSPNQPLTATPYALHTRGVFVDAAGKVGVGTTTPAQALELHGNLLLGQNNVNSFIHGGSHVGISSDANIYFTADSDHEHGFDGNIIFGAGSGKNTDAFRDFTFNQVFPGNEEHMRITGSGKVGIGTNAPTNDLSVAGDADFTGNVGIGTTTPAFPLHVEAAGHGIYQKNGDVEVGTYVTSTGGSLGTRSSHNLNFFTGNSSPQMTIENGSGRIGIGTESPSADIHLRDDSKANLRIESLNGDAELHLNRGNEVTEGSSLFFETAGSGDWQIGTRPGEGDALSFTRGGSYRLHILATGDVGIGTNTPQTKLDVSGEVTCTAANITSDRNAKEDFESIDPSEVLAKVVDMPISKWAYKASPGVRHIGPVAQDFHAAFSLGRDDRHISSVDSDGVALAAIQGLHAIVQEKDAQISALQQQLAELASRLDRLDGNRQAAVENSAPRH